MKITETQKTGADLKVGTLMEQWGALWAVEKVADPDGDNERWLALLWVSGDRSELYDEKCTGTTVFYGMNEPVTVVTIELD